MVSPAPSATYRLPSTGGRRASTRRAAVRRLQARRSAARTLVQGGVLSPSVHEQRNELVGVLPQIEEVLVELLRLSHVAGRRRCTRGAYLGEWRVQSPPCNA